MKGIVTYKDGYIQLPPEVLDKLGWKPHDTIQFTSDNNKIIIERIKNEGSK